MTRVDILSDEFARAAAEAGLRARSDALANGHSVVYLDSLGRYVQEMPDGREFEIEFQPGNPPESHRKIIRELPRRLR